MKPHKHVTFFIDRSLGKRIIAGRLRAEGVSVEIHDDHFPPDCPDEQWLTLTGSRDWIVLTKDRHFQHRDLELAAIARARVRVFQLSTASVQGTEMADVLCKHIDKIGRVAASNAAPFIAKITRAGKITIVFRAAKLKRIFG